MNWDCDALHFIETIVYHYFKNCSISYFNTHFCDYSNPQAKQNCALICFLHMFCTFFKICARPRKLCATQPKPYASFWKLCRKRCNASFRRCAAPKWYVFCLKIQYTTVLKHVLKVSVYAWTFAYNASQLKTHDGNIMSSVVNSNFIYPPTEGRS